MTGPWPRVSIVFLAFNRREQLALSLEQVAEHLDYPGDRLELIVVDNASTDGTPEMVRGRFPQVELIRNPENVGMSGWNVGMSTARGEWRLALDDDCFICGEALKVAVRRAQENDADLVSFRILSGEVAGYSFSDHEDRTGLLSFWGCSAMFSRRAIESEPFYDPRIFIWANEMELTMRLLDRGFRHLYLPEVESVHMKSPTTAFLEPATLANYRHWAYIAVARLRAWDAVGACANLVLHALLQAYSDDRRALKALPAIARGCLLGLRWRRPVRPAVSSVYRRHSRRFVSPLAFLRSPLERLRPGHARASRVARSERWYERRRRLYPTSSAALRL